MCPCVFVGVAGEILRLHGEGESVSVFQELRVNYSSALKVFVAAGLVLLAIKVVS